jgi:hypothetical protein
MGGDEVRVNQVVAFVIPGSADEKLRAETESEKGGKRRKLG